MDFKARLQSGAPILMEGALGERLQREYGLSIDGAVAMASLVYDARGRAALAQLWGQYAAVARAHHLSLLVTTPTRRANRARVAQSPWDEAIIGDNVRFLRGVQRQNGADMHVGGLMGCAGDAYTGAGVLSVPEARCFHAWQAQLFREAGADFLFAGIMPTLPEALGMAQAMSDAKLPAIISFTIRGNGRLIDGTPIDEAIRIIDAETENPPACYMTNCVHPRILQQALNMPFNRTRRVRERFLGIQANTSPLPYDALDGAADLHITPVSWIPPTRQGPAMAEAALRSFAPILFIERRKNPQKCGQSS